MRSLKFSVITFILVALISCSDEKHPLRGDHWTVINYWAVWCKPCREEIPELNELNGHPDVLVLGVNFDRKTGETLEGDSKALGLAFRNIADPSEQLGIKRPTVLPTTVIIAPTGGVETVLVGPQTKESIMAVIRPGLTRSSGKKNAD